MICVPQGALKIGRVLRERECDPDPFNFPAHIGNRYANNAESRPRIPSIIIKITMPGPTLRVMPPWRGARDGVIGLRGPLPRCDGEGMAVFHGNGLMVDAASPGILRLAAHRRDSRV